METQGKEFEDLFDIPDIHNDVIVVGNIHENAEYAILCGEK